MSGYIVTMTSLLVALSIVGNAQADPLEPVPQNYQEAVEELQLIEEVTRGCIGWDYSDDQCIGYSYGPGMTNDACLGWHNGTRCQGVQI